MDDEGLDQILQGIDQCETDVEGGWWETSAGASFGAKIKAELKTWRASRDQQIALAARLEELKSLSYGDDEDEDETIEEQIFRGLYSTMDGNLVTTRIRKLENTLKQPQGNTLNEGNKNG